MSIRKRSVILEGREGSTKKRKTTKDKKKEEQKDADEEIDVLDTYPFEVLPPPPQPAATKRRGTGEIHPNLPQPPFTVAIVGPRKSGKSVTLRNMLDSTREGSYGEAFKACNIVFYSPTMNYDKTIVSLHLINTYGPPTQVPALYQNISEQQESFRQQDDLADVLLVLEDCTNIRDAWPVVTDLGYTGRHKAIHTIVVAHKLTSIPRGNRTQIQQWMLFRPHEESEREWVLYMFTRKATRPIWIRAFHRAWTQKEYNFVYIDFERKGMRNIYRDGFNEPLLTDEEIGMIEQIEMGLPPKLPSDPVTSEFPPETVHGAKSTSSINTVGSSATGTTTKKTPRPTVKKTTRPTRKTTK